jgi:hypothetical protein
MEVDCSCEGARIADGDHRMRDESVDVERSVGVVDEAR